MCMGVFTFDSFNTQENKQKVIYVHFYCDKIYTKYYLSFEPFLNV